MSLVGIKVWEMGDGAKGKCRRWSSRVVSGWKVYIRYIYIYMCVCVCEKGGPRLSKPRG